MKDVLVISDVIFDEVHFTPGYSFLKMNNNEEVVHLWRNRRIQIAYN